MRFALLSVVAHASMLACGSGCRTSSLHSVQRYRRATRRAPRRRRAARRRATPGADMRGEGPAAAPAKEPVITTMPMDVPSGTDLVLTLETPVSSETAKADQPVRAKVAKPVVVAGMEVIPEGAPVTGAVVSAERSGKREGPRIDRAALQRSDGDEHALSHQHRAHRARSRGDQRQGREEDRHRRRASARRSARLPAVGKARRSARASAAPQALARCSRRAGRK